MTKKKFEGTVPLTPEQWRYTFAKMEWEGGLEGYLDYGFETYGDLELAYLVSNCRKAMDRLSAYMEEHRPDDGEEE